MANPLNWLATVLLICISGITSSMANAQESTTLHINAAHDGIVQFEHRFVPPLKRMWTRDLGAIVSYPVTANGLVFVTVAYTPNERVRIVALDLITGAIVWDRIVGKGVLWANAAAENGKVVVTGARQDGSTVIQAYAASRVGELLWQKSVAGGTRSAPTIVEGRVYAEVYFEKPYLFRYGLDTGALQWATFLPDGGTESSPTYGKGGIYLTYPCSAAKIDARSGRIVWGHLFDCTGGGGAASAFYDDRLYARDNYDGDVTLDSATGLPVGSIPSTEPLTFWKSRVAGLHLGLALFNNNLQAVDLDSGNVRWHYYGDNLLSSAPIVINNLVAIGSRTGKLALVDPLTGSEVWTVNVGSPILPSRLGGFWPLTGLGTGPNTLLVPATNTISAYKSR